MYSSWTVVNIHCNSIKAEIFTFHSCHNEAIVSFTRFNAASGDITWLEAFSKHNHQSTDAASCNSSSEIVLQYALNVNFYSYCSCSLFKKLEFENFSNQKLVIAITDGKSLRNSNNHCDLSVWFSNPTLYAKYGKFLYLSLNL